MMVLLLITYLCSLSPLPDGVQMIMLPLLVSFSLAAALLIFSLASPPEWRERFLGSWRKINVISATLAAVGAVFSVATWSSTPPLVLTAIAVSTVSLWFATVQSIYTDPALRLVDRRMLYLSMLPPLILHFIALKDSQVMLTSWVIFMLASGALIFLPGVMGASDGRALLLVAIAAFPILGFRFLTWGFTGFLLIVICYSIIRALQDRRQGSKDNMLKLFTKKRSVPAVPMILAPFAVLIPLVGLISI